VLLPEEANAIDHLLSSLARCGEALGKRRVLPLEELYAFRRGHSLDARRLKTLEPSFGLERPPAKGGELVTEVLDELLELCKGCSFRTYAV
jgi:hypothetical protein